MAVPNLTLSQAPGSWGLTCAGLLARLPLLAGLNVGVAMGAAMAGHLVDAAGMRAGFALAVGAGALVLALAAWTYRTTRHAGSPGSLEKTA